MKRIMCLFGLAGLFLVQCGGSESVSGNQAFAQTQEGESEITPTIKAESITGGGGNVAVDAGFAGNGTTIAIPANFTAAQCKFTAAVANIDGSSISTNVSINTTTGQVTCQKVVQEREEVPPETRDCVASYTVVCVK